MFQQQFCNKIITCIHFCFLNFINLRHEVLVCVCWSIKRLLKSQSGTFWTGATAVRERERQKTLRSTTNHFSIPDCSFFRVPPPPPPPPNTEGLWVDEMSPLSTSAKTWQRLSMHSSSLLHRLHPRAAPFACVPVDVSTPTAEMWSRCSCVNIHGVMLGA